MAHRNAEAGAAATAPSGSRASGGLRSRERIGSHRHMALDEDLRFAQVLRIHLPRLQAAARRILGDDDLASDALQEALVTLWRLGEVPSHVGAWLMRAVIHRSLHTRRTRDRRLHWEERAGLEMLDRCPLCDPERELERRQLLETLQEALEALSAEYRDVFVLRELEGLDYREIAQRLDLPVGTVRSRLSRARRALRQSLAAPPSPRGACLEC